MKSTLFLLVAPAALCQACDTQTVYTTITVTAPEQSSNTSLAGGSSSTSATSVPVVLQPTSAAQEPPAPPTTTRDHTLSSPASSSLQITATTLPAQTLSQTGGLPAPTYNALPPQPIKIQESPQNFQPVQDLHQPGQAVIKNSCSYSLFVDSIGCVAQQQEVAPGTTFTEALCDKAGVSMKITSKQHPTPVQLEYLVDAKGIIWYDVSFLDCMVKESINLTGCAGHEAGIQCGSSHGCDVFACQPGEYCDRSSYTVPEYGLIVGVNDAERVKIGAPVSSCAKGTHPGVAVEFCAQNRVVDARGG